MERCTAQGAVPAILPARHPEMQQFRYEPLKETLSFSPPLGGSPVTTAFT
jgi:hypothetical protein